MKIKILTTGGTIDKIYFDKKSEFQIGDPKAKDVLKRANVVVDFEVESIMRKDSLDLTDKDRKIILDKVKGDLAKRILITHGTDTMVETAKAISEVKDKTIVLTGSMYPAEFRESDAIFNIGSAITAVQILSPGVYIAMNGRVFDPQKVRKNIKLNRFEDI